MRLAQLLFKPRWQDKSAAIRRTAVATSDDTALVAALPHLVREDPDPTVRLAALKRLNDYENWRERSTGDADPAVRETCRNSYLALLCAATSQPPLARRIAELDTLSAEELERVATGSVDRELRAAALAQVNKPAVLADRAVADPDARLRLLALERVTDANLLERIAQKTRKTDKNVSKRARERVDALRIAAGDSSAIVERARALCERVEALMRTPPTDAVAQLEAVDAEWTTWQQHVPAELSARYHGARALALRAAERAHNPPPFSPPVDIPQLAADATFATPTEPAAATMSADNVEQLASRARFDAALAAADAQARAERERRRHLQAEIEARLPELTAVIDAGNAAEAHRAYARIEAELELLAEVPPALQRQLAPLRTRYEELKRWQHWSNNQRRRALCADIEALPASGLHPDAVATRVREVREEWQRMNAAEGATADAEASEGIARRFQGLCQRALRPTKDYFSKRQEVRNTHAGETAALLERIAAVGTDCSDWKAIATLRAEAGTALRALDAVPPQVRTALARQLKEAIARLQTITETHERDVEQAKQRLIEQAIALQSRNDQAGAARDTRELQKKWTALGNGRRNTDQRQWREFRAACDALFGKLDAARKERDGKRAQDQAQAVQLVQEFEQLAAGEIEVADMRARVRELETQWQALACEDRDLLRRQREARDALAQRARETARSQRLARYTDAMRKYALARAGNNEKLAENWSAIPDTGRFESGLLARRDATDEPGTQDADVARDLLVQLEFLAGIESPDEDRQRRMNHQVKRLSSRLRGSAAAPTPEQELETLLLGWFALARQDDALEQRFARAATAAIDALP
jgi:exonuclease SbcC